MTFEGRLARGKMNFDSGKFLDNSETVEYMTTRKPKVEEKPKEETNVKSKSRRTVS